MKGEVESINNFKFFFGGKFSLFEFIKKKKPLAGIRFDEYARGRVDEGQCRSYAAL